MKKRKEKLETKLNQAKITSSCEAEYIKLVTRCPKNVSLLAFNQVK